MKDDKITVTRPTLKMLRETKPANCEMWEHIETVVRYGTKMLNKQ